MTGNAAPKITMITPCYNSAKTIRRTIESVLAQNYERLEYIIIDGGSTDGTVDIIKSYGSRIDKWVSEKDNGIADAFNKGISLATGDLIGIINSDDGLEPDALSTVAAAYTPDADVYRGSLRLWGEGSDVNIVEKPSMTFNYFDTNHINHPSTFVSRAAYKKYGAYNADLKYVMDYDLLLRFQNAGASFVRVDACLAYFTLGGVTFTQQYTPQKLREYRQMLLSNGAKPWDILIFRLIKEAKRLAGRFISKESQLKLKRGA